MELTIHQVQSIKVKPIDTGRGYTSRYIVVEGKDGESITLNMFAETPEKLSIDVAIISKV